MQYLLSIDKREQTPEWAEAAAKKQEVVKEQLDKLGRNRGTKTNPTTDLKSIFLVDKVPDL